MSNRRLNFAFIRFGGRDRDMEKNKNNFNKMKQLFEMPREVISNEPKITIAGFREMLIENYKGILEYEDFYIRINTGLGTINVNGFNLELIQMTGDDIMVTGKIQSVDIEEANESSQGEVDVI